MKKVEAQEIPIVKRILKEYNVQLPDELLESLESTIAYDNQSAIAVSGISCFKEYGILRFVVVKKDYQKQGIGDGIVRASLNAADHNGIKWVFADEKWNTAFLEKIGFERIDEDEINALVGESFVKQPIFGVKLPDFFLKGCKAKRKG
ncbi:MAG: GNAT family N-acetyltransferase [Bacillota bacterium]